MPISLFPSGGFAGSNWSSQGPKTCDDRMLFGALYVVRMHGTAKSTKIPTIPLLLHAFKQTPECGQIFEQTNRRLNVMNVGHPSPANRTAAAFLLESVRRMRVETLRGMWLEHGLLAVAEDGSDEAPHRVVVEKIKPWGCGAPWPFYYGYINWG